jgi:hypothetical protein
MGARESSGADPVHDQGGHVPTLKFKKKKKKNLVGIYKFKKYSYAKVPTLIFVLNPHLRFRKKKLRKINVLKLHQTPQTIQNYRIHHK